MDETEKDATLDEKNAFVSVATYFIHSHSLVPQSVLNSHGIECRLEDEFTISADPLMASGLGGMKLLVRSSDRDRAVELLDELLQDTEQDIEIEEEEWSNPKHEGIEHPNQYRAKAGGASSLAIVLIIVSAIVVYLLLR